MLPSSDSLLTFLHMYAACQNKFRKICRTLLLWFIHLCRTDPTPSMTRNRTNRLLTDYPIGWCGCSLINKHQLRAHCSYRNLRGLHLRFPFRLLGRRASKRLRLSKLKCKCLRAGVISKTRKKRGRTMSFYRKDIPLINISSSLCLDKKRKEILSIFNIIITRCIRKMNIYDPILTINMFSWKISSFTLFGSSSASKYSFDVAKGKSARQLNQIQKLNLYWSKGRQIEDAMI